MAVAPPHTTGSWQYRRWPPTLGLIGTLMLCAAAMMAHLSPPQLQPAAAVLWVLGFLMQTAAFMLALTARRVD